MAVLCLFLLLLADFGLSAGGDTCVMVYVAPGGTALLQLSDAEVARCAGGNCVFRWRKNGDVILTTMENGIRYWKCQPICPNFSNGSLELSKITPEDTGNYSVVRTLRNGTHIFVKCFQLQVQEPVSVPAVNYACRPNASVQLSCSVENGTDPTYSWSLDETPSWTSAKEAMRGYQSVLRNVTCSARNKISEERSHPTDITCPVPVSEPEVEATCAPNGAVRLSCLLVNGTAPLYSWSVNGTQQTASGQELTIDAAVMLNVTCTASNLISQRESKPVNVTCTGGGACECRSHCILWSSLVGAGLLILIALPLVIDCLYPVTH